MCNCLNEVPQEAFPGETPEGIQAQVDAAWKDAVEQKKAIHVEGSGYYFVCVHITPDLKAMKALFGLKSGPMTNPCPLCTVKGDQASLCALDTVWPMRDLDMSVFGIPVDRVHPCTLHCLCRVTEKLVFVTFSSRIHAWCTSGEYPEDWAADMKRAFLEYVNDTLDLNGGM